MTKRWTLAVRLAALSLLILASVAVLSPSTSTAAEPDQAAADAALGWLGDQQLEDGAFASFAGTSDPGTTADAVYAFVAAGVNPWTVRAASGATPIDYLLQAAGETGANPGQAAKVALALAAAGIDPSDAGGTDLLAAIVAGYDLETGFYGQGLFGHAYAVMALDLAGGPVEQGAVDLLLNSQLDDGSWNFNGDTTPGTGDSNTTALVIQALVRLDTGEDAVQAGLEYLLTLQDPAGAFAYDATGAPDLVGDANSTALAIQAFVAAGQDPAALPGGDAVTALTGFQKESGALFWRPDFQDDNLLATVQAIPAFLLIPLPVEAVYQQPSDDGLIVALEPASPEEGCAYFEATSHNVCGVFEVFWIEKGGLAIFGYPLSEAFAEDGLTVQYFERARFEHHPDNAGTEWEITLGRLGADVIEYETSR
jgi:hypothetical protein